MLRLEESGYNKPRAFSSVVAAPHWSINGLGRDLLASPFIFQPSDFDEYTELIGYPPVRDVGDIDRLMFPSSYLSNVTHFLKDWKFDSGSAVKGQNPVRHHNLKGGVSIHDAGGLNFIGSSVAVLENALYPPTLTNCIPAGGALVSLSNTLTDVLRNAQQRIAATHYVEGGTDGSTYYCWFPVEFVYRITENIVEYWYTYYLDHTRGVTRSTSYIGCSVFVVRIFAKLSGDVPVGTEFSTNDFVSCSYSVQVAHVNPYRAGYHSYESFSDVIDPRRGFSNDLLRPGFSTYFETTGHAAHVYVGSQRTTLRDLIGWTPMGYATSGIDHSFKRFVALTREYTSDAFALAGFAASQAVDNGIASFGMNQFENVEGLSSLFGLVDVIKLLREVRRMENGAFSGNILRKSLDLLTDARLVYSYALSPTVTDIRNIREGAARFKHLWLSGGDFASAPLYGDARVTIPTGYVAPFEGMTCDVRVKVVGAFHADSLLYRLLPLDAIGMLPRLSALWATIPFSFVLDNVINVSRALKNVEDTYLLSSVFDVDYSVVSVTFKWEPTKQALADLTNTNADNISSNGFEYRTYVRVAMSRLPVIGPSRLGELLLAFRMPSDFWTYGSLAYKVLL